MKPTVLGKLKNPEELSDGIRARSSSDDCVEVRNFTTSDETQVVPALGRFKLSESFLKVIRTSLIMLSGLTAMMLFTSRPA